MMKYSKFPNLSILVSWLYTLALAFSFVMWYDSRWLENDTTVMTAAAGNLIRTERLLSMGGVKYTNGYGYQSVISMLSLLTGVPVFEIQIFGMPFWLFAVYPLAFVTFRAFTGSPRLAGWAAFLLFLHPDFVFTCLRGSHEKLTYTMILLALFCLLKSLAARRGWLLLAFWVAIFYLAALSLTAMNAYFGSSFLIAVLVSLLASQVVGLLKSVAASARELRVYLRLSYVVLACGILYYLVIVYFYPPAQTLLATLNSFWERLLALFLETNKIQDPYTYIQIGWLNRLAYTALAAFTWVVMIVSFLRWVWQTKVYLWDRKILGANLHEVLLWLLYGGFGFQLGVSLFTDWVGFLGAFQIRLLPIIAIIGIIYTAEGFSALADWASRSGRLAGAARLAVMAAVTWFSIGSFLKAVNEPVLSNAWTSYSLGEKAAVVWISQSLQNSGIWVGLTTRLRDVARSYAANSTIDYDVDAVKPTTRNFLISDLIRLHASRLKFPLVYEYGNFRVYDNGDAQIYHSRPKTPYQP